MPERPDFLRGEGVQIAGKCPDPAAAATKEQGASLRRWSNPGDPAVVWIGDSAHEALPLERAYQPSHRWWTHLLGFRELSEGAGTGEDYHREHREPGRGKTGGVVLPPEPAQQMNRRGMQPGGDVGGHAFRGHLRQRGSDGIIVSTS